MPTYRLAVLGDPIEHSRSPEIHTAMLALTGLEGSYEKVRADRGVLGAAVEGLRKGDWHGLNVTMPLKSAAAHVADRLAPEAARSGSVNTLSWDGTHVTGHSTDTTAFHELIFGDRFGDIGTVLVLGAGGSAAAALVAIADQRRVYVSARRRETAEELCHRFGGDVVQWGAGVADALVVNTTPLGMHMESLPADVLPTAAGLLDLPYSSEPTPAVRHAAEAGKPCAEGYEFLIRQAIASFQLWTGACVGFDELVTTLRKA